MPRELIDEFAPAFVIPRRRNQGVVPERMQRGRINGKLARHEAELDERLYAGLQQAVVDLVKVGKVVDRLAVRIFAVDADVVIEDVVEANVLESGDALHALE